MIREEYQLPIIIITLCLTIFLTVILPNLLSPCWEGCAPQRDFPLNKTGLDPYNVYSDCTRISSTQQHCHAP